MGKEEYLKLMAKLLDGKSNIERKIYKIKEDFINDNKQFNIGEKVKIKGYSKNKELLLEKEVYVKGFNLRDGIVFPKFNDMKKDGTESKKRYHPFLYCEALKFNDSDVIFYAKDMPLSIILD